jgi:hypothetical protein
MGEGEMEWVNAKDQYSRQLLPNSGERVLIWVERDTDGRHDYATMATCTYGQGRSLSWETASSSVPTVTHWMRIEPPE